jgi:hypothetical protein
MTVYIRRPMTDTAHIVSPDDETETECGLPIIATEILADGPAGRECVICKVVDQLRQIADQARDINESLAAIVKEARS